MICDALDTLRRGVGVDTAFGSFFLCDRVPLLVRCGAAEPGVPRAAGVFGIAAEGWVMGAEAVKGEPRAS